MNFLTFVLLVAGLALLVVGAELLVKGSSRLAAMVGISPLVIGLTIVAYGTSSPEMAVSIISSLNGKADIALGNVVGSNIFNALFILGISALIAPLTVALQLVRLDVPIMIGVSTLTLIFGADGKISRVDGIILFIGGVLYTIFLIYQSRKERDREVQEEFAQEYGQSIRSSVKAGLVNLALIAIGLGLLVLGSNWLVESAITIAKVLNVSNLIIGLTIVAAGTSLPELATSAIASFRGERDIAVGNVVGSNIFNILAVLGLSATVSSDGINVSNAALRFDIPVMIAVAIVCLPIFFTGYRIGRREGLLLLGYYIAYAVYLFLNQTRNESLPIFSKALVFVVIPLTILSLAFSTSQALHRQRERKSKRGGT
ncbi:MAG: calcium/sodium antiporter [Hydrococcus sp. C42_A2020_068]|uniref:calcium/sodium antiporter n=1 Tax=Pleurocapsa sp. PCC 7327 TaxID=118163 RepID=UPI0002FF68D3|nr:calcium/sodium antiporter [Pleurocapsa sp. PCC 7327]MBF2022185.1 calcium/sodium antiporter [Hydrococcus sp. C42_A2020_068]